MTLKIWPIAFLGALVSAVVASGLAVGGQLRDSSADVPLPASDVGLQITVTGQALYRDGSGPASPSGTWQFGTGDSPSYQFYASHLGKGCEFGMTMSVWPDLTPPKPVPPVWWVVTTELVSSHLDGATVDITWQRQLNSAAVAGPGTVDRTRRLTLIEGRPHILDYVPIESGDSNCDAMLIQAEIHFVDPPSVADSTLDYELWLIETAAGGSERATRIATSGGQAESVKYEFEAQQFTPSGERDAAGPISMNVGGAVKGRVRTDGRIDLILDARQWFGAESAGRTSYSGRKTLIVSPGEVVEIAMPTPPGGLGHFELQDVFATRRTALRVVTRAS